ncbi:MAG: YgaP family membrane protein [Peptococcaceae bacterium]
MEKNVGDLDSFVRLWGGLFLLGTGIKQDSYLMMALGAGKITEGITRFCPALYALGLSTVEKDHDNPLFHEEKRTQNPQAQYEPQIN